MNTELQATTNLQPGVHDISNDVYHSQHGISRSGIVAFRRSPLHYWNRYLNPLYKEERTKPMIEGELFHTIILEPHKFTDRFIIAPPVDRRTKEGKQIWATLDHVKMNREVITQDQSKMVFNMKASLVSHELAPQLISDAQYERSIYWTDEDTGILCKCRPDIWRDDMICDIKTIADASAHSFRRSTLDYGYHIQAAMIQDGIKSTTGNIIDEFVFIAIEKEEPHAIAIYTLSQQTVEAGRKQYKQTLHRYKECLEANYWPSYEVQEINLPAYAVNQ